MSGAYFYGRWSKARRSYEMINCCREDDGRATAMFGGERMLDGGLSPKKPGFDREARQGDAGLTWLTAGG